MCKLRRKLTDTTGRAEDQHALTRFEAAVVEEALPRGETRHRDRGALDGAECTRLATENLRRDRNVFGGGAVSIEWRERVDGISRNHIGHTRGDVHDDARDLVRRDRGKAVDGPFELVPGQRGGMDADERLAGLELRNGDLVECEVIGASGSVQAHRAHGHALSSLVGTWEVSYQ